MREKKRRLKIPKKVKGERLFEPRGPTWAACIPAIDLIKHGYFMKKNGRERVKKTVVATETVIPARVAVIPSQMAGRNDVSVTGLPNRMASLVFPRLIIP